MTTIAEWDQWFKTTGDAESIKTWNAAKSVHTSPTMLNLWANIIESNRISMAMKDKQEGGDNSDTIKPDSGAGAGCVDSGTGGVANPDTISDS
jgi:hypothetical protein